MNYLKRSLCIMLLWLLTNSTQAQTDTSYHGINFVEGLTWKEVLKKAKKENKYIFVDCFTTWCGPCKMMDKEVYPDKSVGEFFNKHFISVRLQMDKTKNDNDNVRNWYSVAASFTNVYGIPSYPTYLFFSPAGQLVSRDGGYRETSGFNYLGKKAMDPKEAGKYIFFYSALAKYQEGKKAYKIMGALADTAKMLFMDSVANAIASDYRQYLLPRNGEEWMTAQNLSFMANFILGSKDPFFQVFYKRSKEADGLLNQDGRSQYIIDKIIQNEEIDPVVKPIQGMRKFDDLLKEEKEPDWETIQKNITAKYDSVYAERNILFARTRWYVDHLEWGPAAKYFTLFVSKYPPSYIDAEIGVFLNSNSWGVIFVRSVDKDQIDAAINIMGQLIKQLPYPPVLDTYSNLLYKAGRVAEAVAIEQKAVNEMKELKQTLNCMKSGKPTWPQYILKKDRWNGPQ